MQWVVEFFTSGLINSYTFVGSCLLVNLNGSQQNTLCWMRSPPKLHNISMMDTLADITIKPEHMFCFSGGAGINLASPQAASWHSYWCSS
jgi:hypothetical protein